MCIGKTPSMMHSAPAKSDFASADTHLNQKLMFIVGIVTAVFVFFLANALSAE